MSSNTLVLPLASAPDSRLRRPRAVVLDASGTLLYPTRPIGDIYAETALRHGATLDRAALQAGFVRAFRQLIHREPGTIPSDGCDRVWWRQVVKLSVAECALPTDFPFEAYFEELYLVFAQPEIWALYDDVLPALQKLQAAGITLALLSNWDWRLNPLIDGLGLGEYLPKERRFISAERGAQKPHDAIYALVEKELALPAADILLAGDEPDYDVTPAQARGWQAWHVQRPGQTLLHLAQLIAD
ncbi:MAG: HAD family hydrolase [Candidatus Methylacidiphilales bacterium]|nr:HAD family hydrolase [Candidatus Methylacidiphilales bacterium]